MSTKEGQNVWFGVAMFLLGLVVGIILMVVSGVSLGSLQGKKTPTQAPPAQQLSAQDQMIAIAKTLGFSEDAFAACTKDEGGAIVQRINQLEADGQKAGVQGTPGNIVYSIRGKQGILVSGARPIANFKAVIDAMLTNPKYKPTDASLTVATSVTPVDPATDYIRGNKDADLAIIEYSDYQCPYCRRVHPTIEQLLKDYDGKIMWVFRHYPLPPTMHPDAMPYAIGAECVAKLGGTDAFWKFTDAIMTQN